MLDPTYIDSYSGLNGPYQRLDARVKILVALAFVIIMTVSAGDNPTRLIPFSFFAAVLAAVSLVPLTVLLKRCLPAFPFFLFASLILGVTKGGEAAVAGFLKASLSVLTVVILVSTTRFSNLLKGLEGLRLPAILVSMISFVYRYLFIIADEYGHIKIARESRNFGGGRRRQWTTIGHIVGTLFLHSYERGNRVYAAMVARGYKGNIRTLGNQKIDKSDIIFAAASVSYLLLAAMVL